MFIYTLHLFIIVAPRTSVAMHIHSTRVYMCILYNNIIQLSLAEGGKQTATGSVVIENWQISLEKRVRGVNDLIRETAVDPSKVVRIFWLRSNRIYIIEWISYIIVIILYIPTVQRFKYVPDKRECSREALKTMSLVSAVVCLGEYTLGDLCVIFYHGFSTKKKNNLRPVEYLSSLIFGCTRYY